MQYDVKAEQALLVDLWSTHLADNPYDFVKYAYPWGKPGTPLADYRGPRQWQKEELLEIGEHIREQKLRMELGFTPTIFRKARASGRGPGKSALVAWLSHWMFTTHPGSTTIITANTEPQLRTRTFAEIGKWITMSVNAHHFDHGSLVLHPTAWLRSAIEEQLQRDCRYYYIQGQLWSEENPDAFAGAHNPLGLMVNMDEASGIPNSIFGVTEGFYTEPVLHRYWNVFSNPRRNAGAFYDCFHANKAFWKTRQIDSRTVEGTDTALFERMIAQDGIDSYTVRVEVLGQFPRQGDKQFISNDAVYAAQKRALVTDPGAPLIMGLDVARFGDDWNVATFRQGHDARSIPSERWQGIDNYATADKVEKLIEAYDPDAICIDAGQGGGVVDILRRHKFKNVYEIAFGSGADDRQWANKRTELYALVREWLPMACLPDNPRLAGDLTSVDFDYYGKAKDQIILESKDIVKSKIGRSPDDGDSLALTLAVKMPRRDGRMRPGRRRGADRVAKGTDYDVLENS